MIFINKKAFNEEVEKRIGEIHFKTRTDEDIFKLRDEVRRLKDEVSELKFRLTRLEDKDKLTYGTYPTTQGTPVYEQAPYWTNPNWKAPDFTCTAPTGKAIPNTGITTAANSEVKADG